MQQIHERSKHLIIVGALVKNSTDQVLLVRHYKRGWEIPQGHVDAGEGIIDALHREVFEEAGLKISVNGLASVWSKLSDPTSVIFNFLATYVSGDLVSSNETPELGWFEPAEVLDMVTHPVNHDRLKCLLTSTGQTEYHTYTTGPYRILS